MFFFVKQKTAYEMRISDGSSDVCSSDLPDSGGWRCGRVPLHPVTGEGTPKEQPPRKLSGQRTALSGGTLESGRRNPSHRRCKPCEGRDAPPVKALRFRDRGGDGERRRFRHPFSISDRKSVVEGKSVSVRVKLGGRRYINKKIIKKT